MMLSPNLILLLILLVLGTTGTVMLALGVRGRRVGNTPYCFNCGFDLSGLAAAGTVQSSPERRCSECGVKLAYVTSIRVGRHVWRRWMVAIGVVLLAVPATFFVLAARDGNRLTVPIVQLPTPALLQLMRGNPSETVIVELANRVKAGSLDAQQTASLGKKVLAQQGDLSRPWTQGWQYLGVAVYAAGGIAVEDQYAGLRESLTGRMEMRDKIRAGGTQPISVPMDTGRWLLFTPRMYGVSSCTASFHDAHGNVVAVASSDSPAASGSGFASPVPVVHLDVPELPPGRYRAAYTAVMSATEGNWDYDAEQPVNVPLTAEREIEIVASDQPIIEYSTLPDPEINAQQAIPSVRVILLRGRAETKAWVIAETVRNSRCYSYKVFIKATGASDSEKVLLGSVVFADAASPRAGPGSACDRVPAGFTAELVDVILEPDLFGAERDPSITSIERAPLRFEGVPVSTQ
jgi:hypothetical protein